MSTSERRFVGTDDTYTLKGSEAIPGGECRVTIKEDGHLKISYEEPGFGEAIWEGEQLGEGHWVLTSNQDPKDRAEMHQLTPTAHYIEGHVTERDDDGTLVNKMWRIKLSPHIR